MPDDLSQAIATVETYLTAMEARNLDAARACVAAGDLDLTFPGGRRFTRIDEIVANSSGRYASIGKTISRRSAWLEGDGTHVLFAGTLHGRWPDGTPFDGIRFIDLFELRDGLIVRQEVWNDAGERLLTRDKEETR
ncbi:MAG: nuclear transport factor 2 family protein [Phyllobacteriaceae bacterium]|jgi:hypothetical protein|nr:nuclear transport factor 2 family protein [Phyllobacteriaceae bacterium]